MIELSLLIGILIFAFLCEFIDSSLGMGYGTAATPILILLGLPALDIILAVLLSELITGLLSGTIHHKMGNVNLKPGSLHFKVMLTLSICSIIGVIIATFVAVNIPNYYLKLYIGLLVLLMGIIILITRNIKFKFSWKKIISLGSIASFNKGMSGGGYGPVVMGGQILSGVKGKSAVGITSVSEGLTSAVGLLSFAFLGIFVNLDIAIPMIIGASIAVPFAAYTTNKINDKCLTICISLLTIVLGIITLVKIL